MLPYPVYWGDGGWYADVAMPGAAASSYCPFAQLAITRFQRHSLENLSLSSVVLTDMVPLLPDRELTMHTEGNRVTVALSGLSREGDRPNRVIALVEGCDTDDAPGAPVELTSLTGASPGFPVWVRVAGASVTRYTNQELPPLTLPSGPRRLRVVVREYEDLGEVGDGLVDAPSELTERTVYLDIVHLPTN